MQNGMFQPAVGPIRVPHCPPSDPSAVDWGRLPCAAPARLQARFSLHTAHTCAYLSTATGFNISQVVDAVNGANAKIRVADID